MVPFSLHNPRVAGSSLSGVLAVTGRFPQCTIAGLLKAMVCGALSLEHCT